jgi:hypothetical protein
MRQKKERAAPDNGSGAAVGLNNNSDGGGVAWHCEETVPGDWELQRVQECISPRVPHEHRMHDGCKSLMGRLRAEGEAQMAN